MDDLLNQEYNGWENKWTWLVHLHLSNEQVLSLEIARLVMSEPNNEPAGHLVEMWVKSSIAHWMIFSSCVASAAIARLAKGTGSHIKPTSVL